MLYGQALDFLKKLEGGEVDHESDKGGHTNYGVTQGAYDVYRESRSHPKRSVEHITDAEISEFYRDGYWLVAGYGLPDPLDFVVFQFGVVAGPGRSVKLLQKLLSVKQDGVCGWITKDAAKLSNVPCLCEEHCQAQGDYFDKIVKRDPSQEVFIKGWHNRIDHTRRMILEAA